MMSEASNQAGPTGVTLAYLQTGMCEPGSERVEVPLY